MSDANWFVKNAADCPWFGTDKFGQAVNFEGGTRFKQIGVNIHIVAPGQPACLYHRESVEENFLVLSGECILLIEEEEVPLKAWDFVHCGPGATHVFVGAGDGPCAILMIGARSPDKELTYPVSALAQKYGASANAETHEPKVAYAGCGEFRKCDVNWPM